MFFCLTEDCFKILSNVFKYLASYAATWKFIRSRVTIFHFKTFRNIWVCAEYTVSIKENIIILILLLFIMKTFLCVIIAWLSNKMSINKFLYMQHEVVPSIYTKHFIKLSQNKQILYGCSLIAKNQTCESNGEDLLEHHVWNVMCQCWFCGR